MKVKPQKSITIETIIDELAGDLSQARETLAPFIGANMQIMGEVLKVIRRHEKFKLFIQAEKMQAFAEFDQEPDKTSRKGAKVNLNGRLQGFGFDAVCLFDCRLEKQTGQRGHLKKG